MTPVPKMSKEDLAWQARCDARTLTDVHEISNDKARMTRAQAQLKRDAEETQRRADATKKAVASAKNLAKGKSTTVQAKVQPKTTKQASRGKNTIR